MPVRSLLARHRTAAGFLVAAGGAVVVLAGVAVAAIPSTATGTITACVSNRDAAVRIIDFQAGKRCSTSERTVTWNRGWRYRGTWSSTSTYAVGDVVWYGGSSYLARQASTASAQRDCESSDSARATCAGIESG